MRHRAISPITVKSAHEMYTSGASVQDIERRFQLKYATLHRRWRKMGLPLRIDKSTTAKRKNKQADPGSGRLA